MRQAFLDPWLGVVSKGLSERRIARDFIVHGRIHDVENVLPVDQ
jgi:hypothetical protein